MELVRAIGCHVCQTNSSGEYGQGGRGGTHGVDKSPVFDLKRATNFAVAIERVCTGVAGNVNVVWVAR